MYKIIYVNIIEKKYMTVLFMTSSYKTKKSNYIWSYKDINETVRKF